MEDTKPNKREIGPMEWLDDERESGAPPSKRLASLPPSPGHSIGSAQDPPPLITYLSYFREKAESYGDLAAEMIAEKLDGIAYGASRKAAHYGIIANELYAARAKELLDQHPEWALKGHASNFLLVIAALVLR